MLAPLQTLRDGLADLRVQLHIARGVLDLADVGLTATTPAEHLARVTALQDQVRDHSTEFRVHQYRSAVVSLYGYLERFIEDALELSTARFGAIATNYTDLPEAFRKHHFELTIDVLKKRESPKYQDLVIAEDLIARLDQCLTGSPNFSLNAIVFADHAANFKHEVVQGMLDRASCNVRAVQESAGLSSVMAERFPNQERYSVINDLAQRRNEVSHGASSTTLAIPVVLDYVEVVEAYCVAVTSAIVESLASFSVGHVGIPLGTPDQVFNSSIAGITSLPVALVHGDLLGFRRGDGRCAISQIQSMQVEGDPREAVSVGEPVGILTGLKCTGSTELFLMPASLVDLEGQALEVLT